MDDLTQWLGAQLDEDERIARAAHAPNWSTDGRRGIHYGVEGGWMTDALTTGDADHIAAHDPARVLREIDATRVLITQYEHLKYDVMPDDMTGVFALETVIRAKAAVYDVRPGYREEWRP